MTNLVDRIVNESDGKNIVAEIYSTQNGYEVKRYINGEWVGDFSGYSSLEESQNEARQWITSIHVILG